MQLRAVTGLLALLLPLCFLLASCGGGGGGGGGQVTAPVTLKSIDISPSHPIIPYGGSQLLKAMGSYSDGTTRDITSSVTWSLGSPLVANVSGSGLVKAASAGTTTVTALLDGRSKSVSLTVSPAELATISLTPGNPVIPPGVPFRLTAQGRYADGLLQDISNTVTWISSDTTVARIDATGRVTGFKPGLVTITAIQGKVSSSLNLTVNNAAVSGMALSPSSPELAKGEEIRMTATAQFSDGTRLDVSQLATWTIDNPDVASVVSTGVIRGVGAGNTNLRLTFEGNSTIAVIKVTPAILRSITVSPESPTLTPGRSIQLAAWGQFSDGTEVDITRSVNWSSTNTDVATVLAASGMATGVSVGSVTLKAEMDGKQSGVPVKVVNGLWELTAESEPRAGLSLTRMTDGRVLATGGLGKTGYLASAEIYDPSGKRWQAATNMAQHRYFHSATLLRDGSVLVAGGINELQLPVASVELYNPDTDRWLTVDAMSVNRCLHDAVLMGDGRVMVIGGAVSQTEATAGVEIFNPGTRAFEPAPPLINARFYHSATLLANGRVLVAGGRNFAGGNVSAVELYDPVSNAWSIVAPMNQPRAMHTATLLPDGKVLVTGGLSGSDSLLASAELYDPVKDVWTTLPNMSFARQAHSATLLQNGMVLVAGGQTSGVEIFDPAKQEWQQTTPMGLSRTQHRAVRLKDGEVLVVGGSTSSGRVEVYH